MAEVDKTTNPGNAANPQAGGQNAAQTGATTATGSQVTPNPNPQASGDTSKTAPSPDKRTEAEKAADEKAAKDKADQEKAAKEELDKVKKQIEASPFFKQYGDKLGAFGTNKDALLNMAAKVVMGLDMITDMVESLHMPAISGFLGRIKSMVTSALGLPSTPGGAPGTPLSPQQMISKLNEVSGMLVSNLNFSELGDNPAKAVSGQLKAMVHEYGPGQGLAHPEQFDGAIDKAVAEAQANGGLNANNLKVLSDAIAENSKIVLSAEALTTGEAPQVKGSGVTAYNGDPVSTEKPAGAVSLTGNFNARAPNSPVDSQPAPQGASAAPQLASVPVADKKVTATP